MSPPRYRAAPSREEGDFLARITLTSAFRRNPIISGLVDLRLIGPLDIPPVEDPLTTHAVHLDLGPVDHIVVFLAELRDDLDQESREVTQVADDAEARLPEHPATGVVLADANVVLVREFLKVRPRRDLRHDLSHH